MAVIKTVICAFLSLSTLTIANPIPTDVESRDLFQIEPVNTKRSLFNVDNIKEDKDKKYLQEALKEAVDIAGIALKFMDDPKYSSFLSKWFGSDETAADDVRGVLTNFVGDNHNGEGSSVLGEVKVWQEDYWKRPPETPFCDRKGAGGRSPTAYYTKTTKTHAGHSMHYCPKFFERKSKADYLADGCKAIASHIDTDTTTRMYRGANVLHEFMHYEKVGKAQTGDWIADPAYGAYSSYMYKTTDAAKKKETRSTTNADTYVFYTMHIWLSVNCGKDFSFPRGTQDD